MSERPVVVFLHGLARTQLSLAGLRAKVGRAGYETWSRSYPSRRMPVDELAETVSGWIERDLPGRPLAAVTHSLGGILVRFMADRLPWQSLVMLAPPNGGSRVADTMSGNPLFRWYFGPAGQDVRDPVSWPVPEFPFGVIAGTAGASVGNPPSWLVQALDVFPPGHPHDGTVSVAETRLQGMSAFTTVDASHTWIMNHPQTADLVMGFLADQRFP